MPTEAFQEVNNHGFDSDEFLDELHFDEDLSAFSPGTKVLNSPEPKQQSLLSARTASWTDEEVSSNDHDS